MGKQYYLCFRASTWASWVSGAVSIMSKQSHLRDVKEILPLYEKYFKLLKNKLRKGKYE